ncbi:hypothetical protein ACTFIZ_002922 [Dictyostelium cf. discoideum]
MKQKIFSLILLLISIIESGNSIYIPMPIDAIYEDKSFTLIFQSYLPYYTRLILYQNKTTPRYEIAPNSFNCSLVIGDKRHCVFHSEEPLSTLWGTSYSRVCARGLSIPEEDCSFEISATAGYFPWYYPFPFSLEPPTISSIFLDPLTQKVTINGDNFFTNKNLVRVSFDGINQPSFIISEDYTQIQVNVLKRVEPGPMAVNITVGGVSIEKIYIHCFSAKITSIIKTVSLLSNDLGVIFTIYGEMLSSNLNLLVPSITIYDKKCTLLKSTTIELQCQLDHDEYGQDLSVIINIGGCISKSDKSVIFSQLTGDSSNELGKPSNQSNRLNNVLIFCCVILGACSLVACACFFKLISRSKKYFKKKLFLDN